MRSTKILGLLSAAAAAMTVLSGCGSGTTHDANTLTIAYQRVPNNNTRVMDDYLALMKQRFEKANPGKHVELLPITAAENDYYTKLQQMMRSPKTAPDL